MFTKTVPILTNELWSALHSEARDGIISTHKWTHPPKTGYVVDTEFLEVKGFLTIEAIQTWVEIHRAAVDFVPNAYLGAHRALMMNVDSIFVMHVFAAFPDALEFARAQGATYVYKVQDIPELTRAASSDEGDTLDKLLMWVEK